MISRFVANPSIWPVVEKIRKSRRIGLLTNIYPGMLSEIKLAGLLPNVEWDVIVDSSIVKLAKPDPKIFALAEERAGARGGEVLFVENTLRHIQSAQTFSWQTFLYDPSRSEESSYRLSDRIQVL